MTGGNNTVLGTGTVALASTALVPVAVGGTVSYDVSGQGSLSFYAPAEANLGVSGDWDSYTANLSGTVALQLTVGAGVLTLNGAALPAGTYTIATPSATLAGSGPSTAPNFAGSAPITATAATVTSGRGGGTLSVGGKPLPTAGGVTLAGYTGTIGVAARPATGPTPSTSAAPRPTSGCDPARAPPRR